MRSQIKAILSIPIPTPIMITQSPLLEFVRQDGLRPFQANRAKAGHIDDEIDHARVIPGQAGAHVVGQGETELR